MPIYAYACSACGHRHDHLQKMADAPLTVCPECGKETYSKQLSAPPFQLKGGGWYVTDFRDNGKKDGKSSDAKTSTSSTSTASTSDTKSDSKTESKSESSSSTATSTPAATSSTSSSTTSSDTKAA